MVTQGSDVLEFARQLPGVQTASISLQRPMGGDMVWIETPIIRLPGRLNEAVRPREVPVSDGFFETMQIRWIGGHDFLPEDRGQLSVGDRESGFRRHVLSRPRPDRPAVRKDWR